VVKPVRKSDDGSDVSGDEALSDDDEEEIKKALMKSVGLDEDIDNDDAFCQALQDMSEVEDEDDVKDAEDADEDEEAAAAKFFANEFAVDDEEGDVEDVNFEVDGSDDDDFPFEMDDDDIDDDDELDNEEDGKGNFLYLF
jgi:hypothetical protein